MRLIDMLGSAAIETLPKDAAELVVKGVSADSRRIEPGWLFAAIPGTVMDGRDFIPDALKRGAVGVLAPPGTRLPDGYETTPVLETDNPRRRYARMAARFYGAQPATIAAVTGTNGKTSVVHFLRQIWARAGFAAAAAGALGLQSPSWSRDEGLTTPDPADLHADMKRLADDGVTHLAIEASSHGLDQHRLDGLEITVAAFTNLSRDHLDYHGTEEAYLAAKQRLFGELINKSGTAVICADDGRASRVIDAARARGLAVATYGAGGDRFRLVDVRPTAAGQDLNLVIDGRARDLALPLAGRFQALNALCALALAMETGVDAETGLSALENLSGAPGRLELVGETAAGAAVYVDYAHTPDALANALQALRPHAKGALAAVFGCGGDRDRGKRPEMGRVASDLADRVWVTDDNPRGEDPADIRAEILAAASGAEEQGDRRRAIVAAIGALGAGDVLVIAGKGHERGQVVGDRVLPFDDREEARRALDDAAGAVEG